MAHSLTISLKSHFILDHNRVYYTLQSLHRQRYSWFNSGSQKKYSIFLTRIESLNLIQKKLFYKFASFNEVLCNSHVQLGLTSGWLLVKLKGFRVAFFGKPWIKFGSRKFKLPGLESSCSKASQRSSFSAGFMKTATWLSHFKSIENDSLERHKIRSSFSNRYDESIRGPDKVCNPQDRGSERKTNAQLSTVSMSTRSWSSGPETTENTTEDRTERETGCVHAGDNRTANIKPRIA